MLLSSTSNKHSAKKAGSHTHVWNLTLTMSTPNSSATIISEHPPPQSVIFGYGSFAWALRYRGHGCHCKPLLLYWSWPPMFICWFEGNIQNTHYSHWISNMCMTNGSLTFDWLPHLCVVCEFAFIKTFVIMMLIMYSVAAGFHSVRWQPVRSTFKENLQGL